MVYLILYSILLKLGPTFHGVLPICLLLLSGHNLRETDNYEFALYISLVLHASLWSPERPLPAPAPLLNKLEFSLFARWLNSVSYPDRHHKSTAIRRMSCRL